MALRACFENRPVRGPGLQDCGLPAIFCRPRALTRRFCGFFKHAPSRIFPNLVGRSCRFALIFGRRGGGALPTKWTRLSPHHEISGLTPASSSAIIANRRARDRILRHRGRAELLLCPEFLGGAAAPPCQTREEFCPAPPIALSKGAASERLQLSLIKPN